MDMFYDKKADEKLISFIARQDAENTLRQMKDWAAEYGNISVLDVGDLIGITGDHSYHDLIYGWRYSDLPEKVEKVQTNVSCFPVYAIRLPKAKDLRDRPSQNWQKNARPKDGYLTELYAKDALEQIKKVEKRANDAPQAKGEKPGYKFKEKSDDYKLGYRMGYKACAREISIKFEKMLAQMKKELEEAEA